nr:uncharacterized protein LOC133609127 [Nerophis lumbriciformis]
MEDFANPKNYLEMVKAVKYTCGFDTNKFWIPSLANKLGNSLVKVSKLLKAQGLIKNNEELVRNATQFQDVYQSVETEEEDLTREDENCSFPDNEEGAFPTTEEEAIPPPKRLTQLSKEEEVSSGDHAVRHSSKGKAAQKRRPWTQKEVKAVEKHMKRFIPSGIVQAKSDCLKCLRAEPEALQNREWQALKFYVYNRITAYKRRLQVK